MTQTVEALIRTPVGRFPARPALWLTVLAIILFFIWASLAPLEESTAGAGQVVPSSRAIVIQNLEGGILRSVYVKEGDIVDAQQSVAQIDETRFRATFQDLKSQSLAVRASLARLNAELNGDDTIRFDDDLAHHPGVTAVEESLFSERTARQAQTNASFTERIALAERQLKLIKPLVAKKAISSIEVIRRQKEYEDLTAERNETRNKYRQEVAAKIADLTTKLDSITQQMSQQEDALNRTTLTSPARGVVKNLMVTTQGGIIGAGETIMEIVPLDEELIIEARINPKDVAFVRVGMPASITITAFDYAVYGSIPGTLVHISPDTLRDETRDAAPYYLVKIKTDGSLPPAFGEENAIKPGMVASVNIKTGSKTVLQYLLKPITRGNRAFQER